MESCHAQEQVLEQASSESSMPCHTEGKTGHTDKNEHKSHDTCSDCASLCCHLSFYPSYIESETLGIRSIQFTSLWPLMSGHPENFIQENFRPPIYS
jgi:hypothetical protein